MTVTCESRRESRVTPPLQTSVTFAVSHGTPPQPLPTQPYPCLFLRWSLSFESHSSKPKSVTRGLFGLGSYA